MGISVIGIALIMGLVGLGISIGQGIALAKGLEGISRQPEASGPIQTALIAGMAIMETIGVLSFVIAVMLVGKIG